MRLGLKFNIELYPSEDMPDDLVRRLEAQTRFWAENLEAALADRLHKVAPEIKIGFAEDGE